MTTINTKIIASGQSDLDALAEMPKSVTFVKEGIEFRLRSRKNSAVLHGFEYVYSATNTDRQRTLSIFDAKKLIANLPSDANFESFADGVDYEYR